MPSNALGFGQERFLLRLILGLQTGVNTCQQRGPTVAGHNASSGTNG